MRFVLVLLLAAVPAYVLGSVNGAIITSKYLYRRDIREYGSLNPGLTNFYRVFGKAGALLVVAIDVFKTLAPVVFGGWLFVRYLDMPPSEMWLFRQFFDVSLFGQAVTGFFVMLGHCFPLFYRFKGGKGVMATGTILIIVDWRIALISWGAFILISASTRFVSLGAMVGALMYPISVLLFGFGDIKVFTAALLCAALIIARHQANAVRLAKGEESRFSFRRGKG
jgi:glycerol-3-phosphate acyltransferase PlsY